MIYTKKTKIAMKLAYEKHHGQVDKSGLPYIHHPLHLAEQMNTEEACIVALLHDVIEDTNTTFEDLEAFSFGEEIIDALKLLTRNKDEDYFVYVERISKNPIAKQVKIADLMHNSDPTRLSQIYEKDRKRLEKYNKALQILQGV